MFAKNHDHAQFIVERFDANYPHLKGFFARVVDFKTEYAQSLIDDFSIALTDSSRQYRSWLLEDGNGIKVVLHDPLQGHEQLLKRYTDTDMHNVLAYLQTLR